MVKPAEQRLAAARAERDATRAYVFRLEVDETPLMRGARKGPPPPSAQRAVMLVLDVEDRQAVLTEPERVHLSSYLAVRAVERAQYRVTPRGLLVERLREEKAASLAPCVDDGCRIELGKAMAAERLLYPRVLKDGEQCVLGVSQYGLESETARWARIESSECTLSALYRAADRVIEALPPGGESR
jgi:hypothetical protein